MLSLARIQVESKLFQRTKRTENRDYFGNRLGRIERKLAEKKDCFFWEDFLESVFNPFNPSQKPMKLGFLSASLCLVTLTTLSLKASDPGISYPDPPGGWNYIFRGDQAVCGSGAADSLDGTWNRSNGSSEWDC